MGKSEQKKNWPGFISLYDLPVGCKARVCDNQAEGEIKRRMLDIGLVTDTWVEALRVSPVGDPKAFRIRGAVIALRKEDASKIRVSYQ